MSRRTEMLGSTIQRELATVLMRELNDPRLTGMPSITRVKVSPDLSIADVYVTIMGTEGQQSACINALRHSAGLMRTKLTKMLSLRQSPYLKFHIDENLKKEIAVLEALRVVAEENAELDRKRAAAAAPAEDTTVAETESAAETEAAGEPGAATGPAAGDEQTTAEPLARDEKAQ
jgi:ribosome-binding factor A